MRKCSISDCSDKHWARGWCNKHYLRWRRWGDPLRVDPPYVLPVLRGMDNFKWRGDAAKYTAVHHRIYRIRGAAGVHRCQICPAHAEEWAYDRSDPNELIDQDTGYPYSTDPERYMPLCRPCHWRLDRRAVTRARHSVVIIK